MDTVIIAQKLESLRRCLQRVEDKCPEEVSTLANDPDLQDIIVLNLTRAVQLCVDIGGHLITNSTERAPTTMGATFETLAKMHVIDDATARSLRKAVGFRNIAVHNYENVDWKIVYAICQTKLLDFRHFAKTIITYCGL